MAEDEKKLSFDDLQLDETLLRGIYSYGFENPSQIQYSAIPKILSGKDLIAQAQSGTGKTGAFTISSLQKLNQEEKSTQIIIMCPTHELVHQTEKVLMELSKYMDVSILKVMGGTNVQKCIHDLRSSPQIIIGSPGRILDMIYKKHIFTDKVHTFILDEADEMLSYGFMDNIYNMVQCLSKETQICLFSATMPEEILEITTQFMNSPEKILVDKEKLTLEGILQYYINVKRDDWKYEILKDLYDTINISQCIIYINSKGKLRDIHDALHQDNFPVSCISSEMSSEERNDTMKKFKEGHTRILLSTDLLSRGIDIQQLSLVINYDLPRSVETYIHRIGRSGRYGRKGVAINFVSDREMETMREIERHYSTTIEECPQNIQDFIGV
jgi:translation initiation factor 4A